MLTLKINNKKCNNLHSIFSWNLWKIPSSQSMVVAINRRKRCDNKTITFVHMYICHFISNYFNYCTTCILWFNFVNAKHNNIFIFFAKNGRLEL